MFTKTFSVWGNLIHVAYISSCILSERMRPTGASWAGRGGGVER